MAELWGLEGSVSFSMRRSVHKLISKIFFWKHNFVQNLFTNTMIYVITDGNFFWDMHPFQKFGFLTKNSVKSMPMPNPLIGSYQTLHVESCAIPWSVYQISAFYDV